MDYRKETTEMKRRARERARNKRRRRMSRQLQNIGDDLPVILVSTAAFIIGIMMFAVPIVAGIKYPGGGTPSGTENEAQNLVQLGEAGEVTNELATTLGDGSSIEGNTSDGFLIGPDGSAVAGDENAAAGESALGNEIIAGNEAAPTGGIGYHAPETDGYYDLDGTKVLSGYTAQRTDKTKWPSEDAVDSEYAVLIDESTNEVVVGKNEDTIINPASMTKILTVLVAAEHITDLDDKFTITIDITDYSFSHGCSCVGFDVGEEVTVRDLFYGTILPSGADAALGLAIYTAGSHEAFVDMMNEKIKELGLSDTAHFTNCVGLYDKEHYCTMKDMAMMLKAAVQNDWCREVLAAHVYTTSTTEQHPEGLTISNWFLRRIEDRDSHGLVLCAKTGYVDQSRFCAASYFIGNDGKPYIAVTGSTYNNWRAIKDHVSLYSLYACP